MNLSKIHEFELEILLAAFVPEFVQALICQTLTDWII
jgi:hypothetical protein